jgi:DNA invertase Pin-like site-specific DNA recombinase
VRVSTLDQNPERQFFADAACGKDTARSQLEAMLDFVRGGDTLVVHSVDRQVSSAG